jgi:hypothetical protein
MVQTPRTQALQIGQAELEIHLQFLATKSTKNRENMGDVSICFRKHGDETRIHCIFHGNKYMERMMITVTMLKPCSGRKGGLTINIWGIASLF